MVREIYICDQCKKEFDKRDELTTVKLETEPYTLYPSRKRIYWCKDICGECCLKLGIKFVEPKTDIGNQVVSLEARLFEIFQEIAYTVQP